MNILIVSHYFYPENFKVNDIAFEFVKKGNEVTVLTGKPNYPHGKFFDGYGFFKKKEEIINGVRVIRVPLFPRFNGSGKYLILNYLSFLFFSFFGVIFRVKGNYDVIFSHLPSPLTSALPAVFLKRKYKIPLVIWVLDLWPESVSANTRIKKGFIYNMLSKTSKYIYTQSDKILVSSIAFQNSIINNFNISEKKLSYFPNWAEDVFTLSNNLEKMDTIHFPEGYNIVFAGNLGDSQDFENILKAVEITRNSKINWILIGDGRKASWIKKQKNQKNLDRLYILGRYPIEDMPNFFKKADAMLVSLKDEPNFSLTVPAKVQAYLASSKLIIGMLNGEGKDLINNSKSGFAVNAGNYQELAKKSLILSEMNSSEKGKMEHNAISYYNKNFSKATLFSNLEEIFKKIDCE